MTTIVLDIGGTAIKSGLYIDGTLTDLKETPTEASRGGAHVTARAKEIIATYQQHTPFERIGISTAGQVDPVRGQIIYANENIPGYTGTKLKEILEQEFHVPVAVENDVNAAAIGESVFGAGKNRSDFVCLTYGTGVGGAIFSGGKLYSGSTYSAGEFGAIVTHPEARKIEEDMFSGCYEKYASATALVKSAQQFDATLINGRKIFERLEEPDVKELVDRWILEFIWIDYHYPYVESRMYDSWRRHNGTVLCYRTAPRKAVSKYHVQFSTGETGKSSARQPRWNVGRRRTRALERR